MSMGHMHDKEALWNKTFGYSLTMDDNLVLGGDLNVTVNKDEMWGRSGQEDKLCTFFLEKIEACNLIDVEPVVFRGTWFNKWTGDEGIHKFLDHFLVKDDLLQSIHNYQSWVGPIPCSDH
jgi:hypothetical protein